MLTFSIAFVPVVLVLLIFLALMVYYIDLNYLLLYFC